MGCACALHTNSEQKRDSGGGGGVKRQYGAMAAREALFENIEQRAALTLVVGAEEEKKVDELSFFAERLATFFWEDSGDRILGKYMRGKNLRTRHTDETTAWDDYRFRKEYPRRLYTVVQLPSYAGCLRKPQQKCPKNSINLCPSPCSSRRHFS